MNNVKEKVETWVEKGSSAIQVCFLLMTMFLGILVIGLEWQETEIVIVELLTLISLENAVIHIKDSIGQRKLNTLMENGLPVNFSPLGDYSGFNSLIKRAKKDFYISGITLQHLWAHIDQLLNLLDNGVNIKMLISDETNAIENAKVFYGLERQNNNVINQYKESFVSQINISYGEIRHNDKLMEYIKSGKFEIRKTKTVMTTSFVGIDIFSKKPKMLKATFYQYKCNNTKFCPYTVLTEQNRKDNYWFNKMVEYLKMQWKDAEQYNV